MSAKSGKLPRKTLREKRRILKRFIREYDAPLRCRARQLLFGSILCRHEEEDDLMQDTFLRAWRFLDGYDERRSALAWLRAVLLRSFLKSLRKAKRKHDNCIGGEMGEYFFETTSSVENTEQGVISGIVREEVRSCLERVPEPHRTPIMLYILEGKRYKEIAQICSKPIGTIRSEIHRGRQTLKQDKKLRVLLET